MHKWSPKTFCSAGSVTDSIAEFTPEREFGSSDCFFVPEFTPEIKPEIEIEVPISKEELEKEIGNRLKAENEIKLISIQEDNKQLLDNIAEGLKRDAELRISLLSEGAVELAIAIASQVIRKEAEIDKDTLLRVIKPLLYKAESGARLTVTVNPADAEVLEHNVSFCEEMNIIKIVADPRISCGGCTVKTENQEWDLTTESKLEILSETIRETIIIANIASGEDDE